MPEYQKKSLIDKSISYIKETGVGGFLRKAKHKILRTEWRNYRDYRRFTALSGEDLAQQRCVKFTYAPLISIVVPLYRTKEKYLKELIASVKASTYENWELCLADGSGYAPEDESYYKLEKLLTMHKVGDTRIRYERLSGNLGIADNTNAALSMARGEWIAFADHDDTITPDALYELVKGMQEHPDAEFFYSDEDKMDGAGKQYYDPHFKPDFNIDLLRSTNYISHMTAVKASLLERVGGLSKEYDGAQDYDFILRATEAAKQVVHIPRVLYHWRCHKESTAKNMGSKLYAVEAGIRALTAHLQRVYAGTEQEHSTVSEGFQAGAYRVHYPIPAEKPLVSVIIPNMDHIDDLDRCIQSLVKVSDYQNLEILVVENNSKNKETFAYYENICQTYPNVQVIKYENPEGGFNFSRLNNFAAKQAKGSYFLLMNNDVELIDAESIGEMLACCAREEVGIAGAKLLYPDMTIQHAGVVIGFPGGAGHMFYRQPEIDVGYMGRTRMMMDYSAVTAACLMVKKELYWKAGGLDEGFAVAENDVDFCLRIRELGKLVVYVPYARFYHYESKSRGYEDTPEKQARYQREVKRLMERHTKIFETGDPCYNPALSLRYQNSSVKSLEEIRSGQPPYRP